MLMFRKKIRRLLAFFCAVVLMSTQFAVAAYACPQLTPSAEQAAEEANMPPDCAREMESKLSPLCKAHCDQSAQSNQVPTIDNLPLALVELWVVSHLDTFHMLTVPTLRDGPVWLTDGSPPLRIQYQVFRI
jgi:hypothetical protein